MPIKSFKYHQIWQLTIKCHQFQWHDSTRNDLRVNITERGGLRAIISEFNSIKMRVNHMFDIEHLKWVKMREIESNKRSSVQMPNEMKTIIIIQHVFGVWLFLSCWFIVVIVSLPEWLMMPSFFDTFCVCTTERPNDLNPYTQQVELNVPCSCFFCTFFYVLHSRRSVESNKTETKWKRKKKLTF